MTRAETRKNDSLLQSTLQAFQDCSDLSERRFPESEIVIVYFDHLVGKEPLRKDVLELFGHVPPLEIPAILEQSQYCPVMGINELVKGILSGKVGIFHSKEAYLYDAYAPESRSIQPSEMESVITGPQDSFTESLGTNLSLIRRRVKDSRLKTIAFTLGETTATSVNLLYLDGVADPNHVALMKNKLTQLNIEALYDTNTLTQRMEPHPYIIFPQFFTSVRPDFISSKLTKGKLVGLVDGSPVAFSTPTSFFEFFSSPDDYYQPWFVGTSIRLLRFVAFFITLCFTAIYVTLVTYHYEMIPPSLLFNLMESRSKVPFSPLLEAIFMEITIELLREAGARLPTKIGQTIGIVGGIVIGQASVQAGVTSNILIIAVATSAIASFAIPSYIMGTTIRMLRFGIIILAGLFGNFGLIIGLSYFIIQLSGLNMFGVSYLYPLSPSRPVRWLDIFIRAPFKLLQKTKAK